MLAPHVEDALGRLAELAEAALDVAHHRPTCWSCCWTLAPTCPICAVIWAENWASSSVTVASVSRQRLAAPRSRAASTSRWRSSRAWSGCCRGAPRAPPSRATARQQRPARCTPTSDREHRDDDATATPAITRALRAGPRQWRHTGRSPQGAQTAASRRFRHWPDMRLWQSAKSYFTGSAGIEHARAAR